jgi:hypothetical protein
MNEQLIRDVVLVGHKVYAVDEITDEAVAAVDAIVSIDDPEEPVPNKVSLSNKRHLVLRFFDYDHEDDQSPQLGHVRDLIAFPAETRPGEKLLVHCYAGISRSTAALAIIFASGNRKGTGFGNRNAPTSRRRFGVAGSFSRRRRVGRPPVLCSVAVSRDRDDMSVVNKSV